MKPPGNGVCLFSEDRKYRYSLWRCWGDLLDQSDEYVAFLCLNPSIADETIDDNTVRRCIGFSKRWGYSNYCMLNLFGYRSTDPLAMLAEPDPIGPINDATILEISKGASILICAWGNHGAHRNRHWDVTGMLQNAGVKLMRLGALTSTGQPRHPLYLAGHMDPEPL